MDHVQTHEATVCPTALFVINKTFPASAALIIDDLINIQQQHQKIHYN